MWFYCYFWCWCSEAGYQWREFSERYNDFPPLAYQAAVNDALQVIQKGKQAIVTDESGAQVWPRLQ